MKFNIQPKKSRQRIGPTSPMLRRTTYAFFVNVVNYEICDTVMGLENGEDNLGFFTVF